MAKALFYTLAPALMLSVCSGGCAAPVSKPNAAQTFVDKLGASLKSGTSKVAAAVMPKKAPRPPLVNSPNGKPGPNVFVAVAQMHERSGKYDEAEAHYRKALAIDSRHKGALIGFARLEDRRSNFEAATRLYRRAIKAHSKDASVHNDLGLCFHRRGMLPEATRELKRAVELDKANKLHRNNLAAVYIEQGQSDQALAQLTAAHGKSVGHYNLGYLLLQKGDRRAALYHFQKAAETDRNLIAARHWVAKLSAPPGHHAVHGGAPPIARSSPAPYHSHAAPPPAATRPAYVAQRVPQPQARPPQHAPATYTRSPASMPAPPTRSDPMPPVPR